MAIFSHSNKKKLSPLVKSTFSCKFSFLRLLIKHKHIWVSLSTSLGCSQVDPIKNRHTDVEKKQTLLLKWLSNLDSEKVVHKKIRESIYKWDHYIHGPMSIINICLRWHILMIIFLFRVSRKSSNAHYVS